MRLNGFNPSGAAWQQQQASACDPSSINQTQSGQASAQVPAQFSVPTAGMSALQTTTSQAFDNNATAIFPQSAASSDATALHEQFNLVFGFISALFAQFSGQASQAPANLSATISNADKPITNPFTAFGGSTQLQNTAGGKQMVVLDDANTGHGQTVMDVASQMLLKNGVQKVQPQFIQQRVSSPDYKNLGQTVDTLLSGSLNDRASEITQLTQSGKVGVINISNGLSPVDIMEQLGNLAKSDPAARKDMEENLGLNESSSWPQFYQAMAEYIGQRMQTSQTYQQALGNYQQATKFAESNNVAVVVAAGNSADELAGLRKAGISIDDELGLNLLTNSNNVINVGAVNDNGTADMGDDKATDFSSVGNRIQFAANGVKVLGNASYEGTSYSAPQVSGLIASIQAENPNLSIAQIKQILAQTANKTAGVSAAQQGAGTVQWGNALSMGMQVA